MFNFRRKEIPWEVVDSEIVEPIPVYYDEEGTWGPQLLSLLTDDVHTV